MVTELKPYPGYKDSGVPWLGDVPEHWVVRRIKTLFREREERSSDGTGLLLSLTRARGLVPQSEASNRIAGADDLTNYKVCRPGDLVMNRMQAWSGMFAVSPLAGLVSPDYSVFEAIEPCKTEHFAHLFRTSVTVDQFAKASKGIGSGFNRLYTPDFRAVPIVIPPLPEQVAIVRFLDHVDRRIRRYIRAKQKLISLLEEQKQAIIHEAVTGQIDVRTGQPYTAYRACDVPGLARLPMGWDLCRLRNVVSVVTTGSRGWSSYAADTGPLFVRVANLSRGTLQLRFDDEVRLSLPATTEAPRTRIVAGDLLVSVTAYIGSIGVAPDEFEEAYVSQHVARCQPLPGMHGRWLGYMLLSRVGQTHGQVSLYGGTKDGLSLDDVKNYPILLPPRQEQEEAVRWIERRLSALAQIGDRTVRGIAMLGEWRARLVADVVTGKLDVREAAAGLPQVDQLVAERDPVDGVDHDAGSDLVGWRRGGGR